MKSDKVYRAIGGIDADLIEAADQEVSRPAITPVRRRVLRVLLAAALTVLLVGSVYGISRWIRVRTATEFPADSISEQNTDNHVPTFPAPQTVMEFEAGKGGNYIGFLLPEAYAVNADAVSSNTLAELFRETGVEGAKLDDETLSKAYVHYRSKDEDRNLLAIEVLDAGAADYRSYFSRYEIRVEKEAEINGMEGMWIYTKVFDLDTFNLFLKNDPLGCIVVVSSLDSFDAAEQAARDLTLVDSGAAALPAGTDTVYALKLTGTPPEGLEIEHTSAMDVILAGSEIADPTLDLTELYDSHTLWRTGAEGEEEGLLICMLLNGERGFPEHMNEANGYFLVKEESLAGGEARWYDFRGDTDSTVLVIYYPDKAVTLTLEGFGVFRDEYKSDFLWYVSSMELIGIPVSKAAPVEFNIISAG